MLWELIILGPYKMSFLERLSSSQRVPYRRFYCIVDVHNYVWYYLPLASNSQWTGPVTMLNAPG